MGSRQPLSVAGEPRGRPVPDGPVGDSDGRPSFREVFDGHFWYVLNSLRRLGVRAPDLKDLTHDAFIVVARRLGDYDPARPIRPWLFGIAFRVASDYGRLARHKREALVDQMPDIADPTPDAEAAIEAQEARALVVAALGTLEMGRRAVLVMHDIDGATMPEIAAALSLPLDTGYSRLRLARKELQEAFERLRRRRGDHEP
jgi:RNA polymerase sigma-70 factor (ECF subfamily)